MADTELLDPTIGAVLEVQADRSVNPNESLVPVEPSQTIIRPSKRRFQQSNQGQYTSLEDSRYIPVSNQSRPSAIPRYDAKNNPLSDIHGRNRRPANIVSRVGKVLPASNLGRLRGLISKGLPIAGNVLEAAQILIPEPCPQMTDEEFYGSLQLEQETIERNIQIANTIDGVNETANGACVASFGALAVSAIASGLTGGAAIPFLAGSNAFFTYSCGSAAVTGVADWASDNIQRRSANIVSRINATEQIQEAPNLINDPCKPKLDQDLVEKTISSCCYLACYVYAEEGKNDQGNPVIRIFYEIEANDNSPIVSSWIKINGNYIPIYFDPNQTELSGSVDALESNGAKFDGTNNIILYAKSGTTAKYAQYTTIAQTIDEAILPEIYNIRKGNNVPQLIIKFKEINSDNTFGTRSARMTIPYPANTSKLSSSPIPGHKRGKYRVWYELDNGPDVVGYFPDLEYGKNFLDQYAISLIDSDKQLGKELQHKPMDVDLARFPEINVKPVEIRFYQNGAFGADGNLLPKYKATWTTKLR